MSGPTSYLSGVEEDELVKFLLTYTNIGIPKTRVKVVGIVRKDSMVKVGGIDFRKGTPNVLCVGVMP